MRKQRKQILVLTMIAVFMATSLFFPEIAGAGDENKKPKPHDAIMTMLDEIYDIVLDTNLKVTPATCTGAPVAKTGQTICYDTNGDIIGCADTGQDGEYQYGTPWPVPRFTDNTDGTVTDNLTGLIWLKDANRFGPRNWAEALSDCNNLAHDGVNLTDGSSAGDWRLPNIRELHSLIDFSNYDPALPSGHPFTGVQSTDSYYWSSTTPAYHSVHAWYVIIYNGSVGNHTKGTNNDYVWPVRGGNFNNLSISKGRVSKWLCL